MKRSDWG